MADLTIITCTELKRGPTSWFQFSILSRVNIKKRSGIFEIGKLAYIQLKFINVNADHFIINMFYKKKELAGNSFTKINFSSKTLKYSANFCCSENWSKVSLGKLKYSEIFIMPGNVNIYTTKIDLIVNVSREDTIISNPLLYEDQDFTDFELKAADGSVAVHKNCLAARSDVFRRMFAGEWKETVDGGVEIKDVTKQTLQDMKDFIYMGRLPDDGLRPLIVVAKKYMITDLVEACAKKLAETVLAEDLYSLHEFAGLPELSCAIAELTPDGVIHEAYEIKMAKRNTALKNDTK